MKVTVRSIAKLANVSRGTIDRVLNDRPGVNPEVREKIKKILEEMDYKPNIAGKALAFQKNPVKIGVIILSKDDLVYQEVYEGVKSVSLELKDFGIIVECCLMEGHDVNEQLMYIRELKSKNISALAISPLDEDVIREELKKLSDENIKIVTFNTDITDTDRVCFIGQDLKKSGRVAGDLIGKLLPDGGNVLIITGQKKIKALQERIKGFKDILEEEYPKVKITDILQKGNIEKTSYIDTLEILKSKNDINAIFITDRGIGGAGKAIIELNKRHIKLVCYDKIPETIELIRDKIVDFTITQDPFMQGYLPIKILFDFFFHNIQPENEQVYTKLEIVTKENI